MNEFENTVKIPTKSKFSIVPQDDSEKQHLEKLENLLKQKRRGDWQLVGELTKLESKTAEKAFYRVYSKNHLDVVNALDEIIENRKKLLNPKK